MFAHASPQVTLSQNNRIVAIVRGTGSPHSTKFVGATKYLFTNFAKEREGLYGGYESYGITISGPSSFFGVAYGVAEQFMLKESASATRLVAAVGYVSGNDSVTLTLYADNGNNSPGAVLSSGTSATKTEFGACCGVTSVTIPSTSLNAGTRYWIGITTTGSNFEASMREISDQVDEYAYAAYTSNGGSTWGAGSLTFGPDLSAIGIK